MQAKNEIAAEDIKKALASDQGFQKFPGISVRLRRLPQATACHCVDRICMPHSVLKMGHAALC